MTTTHPSANDSGLNLDHLEAEFNTARVRIAQQIYDSGLRGDDAEMRALFLLWQDGRAALANQPAPTVPAGDALRDWKLGQWFDAQTLDEMQAFYLSRLPAIRAAAAEHGYAIGLHGSERRDFDLMAMQWRDGASDKDTLARAIADAACGIRREGAYDWEQKPSGRLATSIPVCWTAYDNPDFDKPSVGHIDLSLIAHQPAQEQAEPVAWSYECVQPATDGKVWCEFINREKPVADKRTRNIRPLYAAQQEPVAAPQQGEARYQWFRDWYLRGGQRLEIDPWGHVRVTTAEMVDDAIDAAIQRAGQLDGGQEGSESNG
jgi:hypothetical protein